MEGTADSQDLRTATLGADWGGHGQGDPTACLRVLGRTLLGFRGVCWGTGNLKGLEGVLASGSQHTRYSWGHPGRGAEHSLMRGAQPRQIE